MLVLLFTALMTLSAASNFESEGHVRRFSCGKLNYRTFLLSESLNTLYVGAMDRIFKLRASNITLTSCYKDSLSLKAPNQRRCSAKDKSKRYECRNHIKVIQPMKDDQLYVCGTNAQDPRVWVVQADLSSINETAPESGSGVGRCPFSPDDNSTAVWVEDGNPDDLPGLYSGTVADITKRHKAIFRSSLLNESTSEEIYPSMSTANDSKWLDDPEFVGSFDIDEYVYFFFREKSYDRSKRQEVVQSRVGRFCKRDTGNSKVLGSKWATFLKATLNCSLPGDESITFNEIQSVSKTSGNNSMFYAVFTSAENSSAICAFSLDSMNDAFNGNIKEDGPWRREWEKLLSAKDPDYRPGSCANDTQTLPDSVLMFMEFHSLMDSTVDNVEDKPIYYTDDLIFTTVTAYRDEPGGEEVRTVFAGTNDGRVFKVVHNNASSRLVDIISVVTPDPIRVMEISPKHGTFFAASDDDVVQIDLVMCEERYQTLIRCIRDPHCEWNYANERCKDRGESEAGVTEENKCAPNNTELLKQFDDECANTSNHKCPTIKCPSLKCPTLKCPNLVCPTLRCPTLVCPNTALASE